MSIFKKFNDFKTNNEKERNIELGYNCKSCYEKILDKQKWGKPTLCEGCEDAISSNYTGK